MAELIFADKERRLLLQRSNSYAPQFVEFLEGIVWGSGGVQYTMHHVADTLNRFTSPHFFTLTEDGQIVAVVTLNQKTTRLSGKTYPAFYSYGIAVDPSKRGLGYGTLIAQHRLRYALANLGEKGLLYSYIEATNISSLKTNLKVGSKSMGLYQALVISRLRPRDDARFRRLKETERNHLVQLLSQQYENHALTDFEQSVTVNNCYILEQGGEIVAGLQCHRQHLTIRQLPGAGGQILVKLLPHIPLLRRLFPHRNFQFLTFGNCYAQFGMEGELFTLMEAMLARHGLNFGMIYLDKRSPMYQRLKAVGNFGVLHALIDIPVHVMAFFKGFSEKERADLQRQPLFISIHDPV